MNRLLEESVVTTPAARGSLGGMQMPLDIYETPDALVGREFYQPTEHGMEAKIAEKLQSIRAARAQALKDKGGQ